MSCDWHLLTRKISDSLIMEAVTPTMVEKEGSGPLKVLVIPPILERNWRLLYNMLDPAFKKKITFYTISSAPRRENGAVNFERLLQECQELIRRVNINAVYANKQTASLVLAILCEEFPKLRGPSVESVFLCNHKYYTTLCVDSRKQKLPYHLEVIDRDPYDTAYRLISAIRLPCIVRVCLGSGHTPYIAHNKDELLHVLTKCKFDVIHIVDMQRWLLQRYVDKSKYPMATRHGILVNSYLDHFSSTLGSTWINAHIEACVWQKDIIPWAICNAVNLPYGLRSVTHFFPGLEMPTKLSPFLQEKLWRDFKLDIQNLLSHGLKDSFVHAEYMVFEDGYVHLVDINSSVHARCTPMYDLALKDGNNTQAAMQLALGMRPKFPSLTGKYVLSYTMMISESQKADKLINFDQALNHPNVTLRFWPHQSIVMEPAKNSTAIGTITVAGSGFKACLERIKEIRSQILKLPELVPLTV